MIQGGTGNALSINGGEGDDWIEAGLGQKVIHGDDGNDTLGGIRASSVAYGDNGDDSLRANHSYSIKLNNDGLALDDETRDHIWQDVLEGLSLRALSPGFYNNEEGYKASQFAGLVTSGPFSNNSHRGNGWQYQFRFETQSNGTTDTFLEYKNLSQNIDDWQSVGGIESYPYD